MKRWRLNLQDRLTRDPFMRRLWRDVRRQGLSSVSSWDDAEVQYWEYTVGYDESLNQPEIVVGGLPPYQGRQAFASIQRPCGTAPCNSRTASAGAPTGLTSTFFVSFTRPGSRPIGWR